MTCMDTGGDPFVVEPEFSPAPLDTTGVQQYSGGMDNRVHCRQPGASTCGGAHLERVRQAGSTSVWLAGKTDAQRGDRAPDGRLASVLRQT